MFHLIIVSLLLTQGLNSMAQHCAIKGKVTAFPTGKALPGTSVRSTTNYYMGTTTNTEGEFELAVSRDDTLILTHLGFDVLKIPVAAISNCEVHASLNPLENIIPEVEISAERLIAEEFTVRKLTKLNIYTNPSAKADPILAVNSMPSATTMDESANISLRGSGPGETGVFLNNVPINEVARFSQLNGIGTFSIFNTALVNSLTVYPGNPPLEYGSSTSGVISIQTDEMLPKKPVNTLSLTLASAGLYTARKLNKNSSLTIFSNYQPSHFIRSVNYNAMKDLRKFSSVDMGLHYFKKVKNNTTIKLFNYSLNETYRIHYEQPAFEGFFGQNKIRNLTIGNVRRRIGKNELSFNQGLSFSSANYHYGITDIDLSLKDLFASLNFLRTGINSEWKTGISYDHKSSVFIGTFPTFPFASGENHPTTYLSSKTKLTNPEWYGYYKYYFGARWIAGVGARKNLPDDNTNDYLSLQGNIHYNFHNNITLNLAGGKYHKTHLPQPENKQSFFTDCHQYSADMNFQGTKAESTFSLFYKTGKTGQKNYRVKGIELFTKHTFNSNFRAQVSLTSLSATETQENITMPSAYNIHYFIRGNIEYKIKGTWTLTSVFLFRQGSYYHRVLNRFFNEPLKVYEPIYDSMPERLPSYNTLDVSISKIFPVKERSAIAFLSFGNIVNWKNVRDYSYNFDYTVRESQLFSQRTLYFGLIINF